MVQVALAVELMPSALATTVAADVVQITPPLAFVTVKVTVPWLTCPTAG